MNLNQILMVAVTNDQKAWTYWVEDRPASKWNQLIPERANANKQTVAATLATAIQNELPTLST
jgi:hypothetical protein